MQFAALRTDPELQPIGEPVVEYCCLPEDILPDPEACLVTGLSPQLVHERGVAEARFAARIDDLMSAPETCVVGYNSIRFDDEFVRFLLYRNFYDPYGREWRGDNSRWDLLDVARMTYALRPEGIRWPKDDDDLVRVNLEGLARANSIEHGHAHDALSDVEALVALARLIRSAQPRLFEYAFRLRDKRAVLNLIDPIRMKPFVHVSGRLPRARRHAALVCPLAWHPTNGNAVVVWDLADDPSVLDGMTPDEMRARIFTGEERLPIKLIHANRCPAVAPLSILDANVAQRLSIDIRSSRRHYAWLREHVKARRGVYEAYQSDRTYAPRDADAALYDGFFEDEDRNAMYRLHDLEPKDLRSVGFSGRDPRLPELLFRYRARNYPETLNAEEKKRWHDTVRKKWLAVECESRAIDTYFERLTRLLEADDVRPGTESLLHDLQRHARTMAARFAIELKH